MASEEGIHLRLSFDTSANTPFGVYVILLKGYSEELKFFSKDLHSQVLGAHFCGSPDI